MAHGFLVFMFALYSLAIVGAAIGVGKVRKAPTRVQTNVSIAINAAIIAFLYLLFW